MRHSNALNRPVSRSNQKQKHRRSHLIKASHIFLYHLRFLRHNLKTIGLCIFLKPYLEKHTNYHIHYATCNVPTHLRVYEILNCKVIWRELCKLFPKSSQDKPCFAFCIPLHWQYQSINTAQKMKFSILRIFSVNVTKSAWNCRFGHTYWRNF